VQASLVQPEGGAMTDSRATGNADPARAPVSRFAVNFARWLEALNAFFEKAFRTADVETGC